MSVPDWNWPAIPKPTPTEAILHESIEPAEIKVNGTVVGHGWPGMLEALKRMVS